MTAIAVSILPSGKCHSSRPLGSGSPWHFEQVWLGLRDLPSIGTYLSPLPPGDSVALGPGYVFLQFQRNIGQLFTTSLTYGLCRSRLSRLFSSCWWLAPFARSGQCEAGSVQVGVAEIAHWTATIHASRHLARRSVWQLPNPEGIAITPVGDPNHCDAAGRVIYVRFIS